MGLLDEVGKIAGAVAAVEAAEKVDPDAGLLTKGVAAVAGFEGAGALETARSRTTPTILKPPTIRILRRDFALLANPSRTGQPLAGLARFVMVSRHWSPQQFARLCSFITATCEHLKLRTIL
jgi:hypothetical protein